VFHHSSFPGKEFRQKAGKAARVAGGITRDITTASLSTTGRILTRLGDAMAPQVTTARQRVEPLVTDAAGRMAPHISHVGKKAGQAQELVAPLYRKAHDALAERLDASQAGLTRSFDSTIKPHLEELADRATHNEFVATAAEKGSAAMKELKAVVPDTHVEASVVEVAGKKKHHRVLKGLGIAALVGGAVVAVRQLLLPKDDGWTPQEPSEAYTDYDLDYDYPSDTLNHLKEDSFDTEPGGASKGTEPAGASEHMEPADVTVSPESMDLPHDGAESGYRGDNPPEGYTIKGNERSMKFHVPGGVGYARTQADVWFQSLEDAQAAGFTKASR